MRRAGKAIVVLGMIVAALGVAPAGAAGPGPWVRVAIRPAFVNVPLDARASFSYVPGSGSCSKDYRSPEALISRLPSPLPLFNAVGGGACGQGVMNAAYRLTIVQPDGPTTATSVVVSSEVHGVQWIFRVRCSPSTGGGAGPLTCASQPARVSPDGRQYPLLHVTFVS